jgi:hypothetical protein
MGNDRPRAARIAAYCRDGPPEGSLFLLLFAELSAIDIRLAAETLAGRLHRRSNNSEQNSGRAAMQKRKSSIGRQAPRSYCKDARSSVWQLSGLESSEQLMLRS